MDLEYNPLNYMIRIQSLKLKAIAVPIVMVISGLGLNLLLRIDSLKYLSLLGFLLYIIVQFGYRYRKNFRNRADNNNYLSPVSGRIAKISNHRIFIRKGFFDPGDIRAPEKGDLSSFRMTGKRIFLFQEDSELPGQLIGLAAWTADCECTIPSELELQVSSGERVRSGETVLAGNRIQSERETS